MKLAARWEVKEVDGERSIQLFDSEGNKLDWPCRWEGGFDCSYSNLTSLKGAPEEVGGHFNCYDNNLTTLEGAPEEVGGGFYCYNNKLTSLEGAPEENVNLFASYLSRGYVFADRILQKLVSTKVVGDLTIYRTRKVGSKKKQFVVKQGETFAHGETVKKAVEDLAYKISDRDLSEYESWTPETISTKNALIHCYMKITGACSVGTKDFIESNSDKIKEEMSIKEVIDITKGHYGHDEFRRFFID